MPIPASCLGRSLPDVETFIDTRWIMSYAAGLGDTLPQYLDSAVEPAEIRATNDFHARGMQGGGVIAHPVFCWAVEWPITWLQMGSMYAPDASKGETGMQADEAGTGVHFFEDIVIERPIIAGDTLKTSTQIVGCELKSKGTVTTCRFDHRDADGTLISTSWNGGYNRGVGLEGESGTLSDLMPPPAPKLPDSANPASPLQIFELSVSAVEAHVYTECSRIWNPIHTDRAAALAAGLPDIILHGTATLARAVSTLITEYAGDEPKRVRRVIAGAFGAMVLMPSTITVRVLAAESTTDSTIVHYDVLNQQGQQAIRGGVLVIAARAAL